MRVKVRIKMRVSSKGRIHFRLSKNSLRIFRSLLRSLNLQRLRRNSLPLLMTSTWKCSTARSSIFLWCRTRMSSISSAHFLLMMQLDFRISQTKRSLCKNKSKCIAISLHLPCSTVRQTSCVWTTRAYSLPFITSRVPTNNIWRLLSWRNAVGNSISDSKPGSRSRWILNTQGRANNNRRPKRSTSILKTNGESKQVLQTRSTLMIQSSRPTLRTN